MGVMVKKIFLLALIIPFIVVVLAIYSISTLNIQQLVICSSDDNAFYIPKNICKYYMYNYRGSSEDINVLEKNYNISYLFSTQNANEKYNEIEFFLKKGANV